MSERIVLAEEEGLVSDHVLGTRGILDPFPTNATDLIFVSDSPEDSQTGTGARIVDAEVVYRSAQGALSVKVGTVYLNGMDAVSMTDFQDLPSSDGGGVLVSEGVLRVRLLSLSSANVGSTGSAVGTITAKIDGISVSEILPGHTGSTLGVWSTGERREKVVFLRIGLLREGGGGQDPGFTSFTSICQIGTNLWRKVSPSFYMQSGQVSAGPINLPILEGHDLRVEITETVGSWDISASFTIA